MKYQVKYSIPGFEKNQIIESENGSYNHIELGKVQLTDFPDVFIILDEIILTEDEISIFHNDKLYKVCTDSSIGKYFEPEILIADELKRGQYKHEKIKYFSTKQAAELWIDENKPVFSKKDIISSLGENSLNGMILNSEI